MLLYIHASLHYYTLTLYPPHAYPILMTVTRFIRIASRSILYGLMLLLLWGCRASREAQTEEAQLPSEGTMLTYDAEAVGFPPHTFIFTLPLVPSIEESWEKINIKAYEECKSINVWMGIPPSYQWGVRNSLLGYRPRIG